MKKIEIQNHRASKLGFNGDEVLLIPGKNLVDLDKWERVKKASADFVEHYLKLGENRSPKDKNLLGISEGKVVEVELKEAAVPGTVGEALHAIINTDSDEQVSLWLKGEVRPKVVEALRKRKAALAPKATPKAEPKADAAKADDKAPKGKQPVKA